MGSELWVQVIADPLHHAPYPACQLSLFQFFGHGTRDLKPALETARTP